MIDSWIFALVYAIPTLIYVYCIIRYKVHLWIPLLVCASLLGLYFFITLFNQEILVARHAAMRVLLFTGGLLTILALDTLTILRWLSRRG